MRGWRHEIFGHAALDLVEGGWALPSKRQAGDERDRSGKRRLNNIELGLGIERLRQRPQAPLDRFASQMVPTGVEQAATARRPARRGWPSARLDPPVSRCASGSPAPCRARSSRSAVTSDAMSGKSLSAPPNPHAARAPAGCARECRCRASCRAARSPFHVRREIEVADQATSLSRLAARRTRLSAGASSANSGAIHSASRGRAAQSAQCGALQTRPRQSADPIARVAASSAW